MATLNVTEFSKIFNSDGSIRVPFFEMPYEPAVVTEVVTFTTSTEKTTAFNANTDYVRLMASADCHIVFGTGTTATTSDEKFIADVEYFRGVNPGEKLSVVTA